MFALILHFFNNREGKREIISYFGFEFLADDHGTGCHGGWAREKLLLTSAVHQLYSWNLSHMANVLISQCCFYACTMLLLVPFSTVQACGILKFTPLETLRSQIVSTFY